MKPLLLFIPILLLFLFSCSSDNYTSGIKGKIEFAEVDCSIDQSFWQYENYNGMVYAIPKDSVSSGSGNYMQYADSSRASNGEFTIGLTPGYYYIFIEEYQAFNLNTEVVVYLNQVTEKEFRFYKCL